MHCTPYCIYSNILFAIPGLYASSIGLNYFAAHTLACGIASSMYHLSNQMLFKDLDVYLARLLCVVVVMCHCTMHTSIKTVHTIFLCLLSAGALHSYLKAGTFLNSTTYSFYHTIWHVCCSTLLLSWFYTLNDTVAEHGNESISRRSKQKR